MCGSATSSTWLHSSATKTHEATREPFDQSISPRLELVAYSAASILVRLRLALPAFSPSFFTCSVFVRERFEGRGPRRPHEPKPKLGLKLTATVVLDNFQCRSL